MSKKILSSEMEILMMEAVSFSEKLMILYHSASHAFPKGSKFQEMLLKNYFIIAQYLSLII